MKKAIALAAFALLPAITSEIAPGPEARGHRHHYVHRHVWVGHRIVVGRPVRVAPVVVSGRPHGAIDFDVTPEATKVYVEGELRGVVDDFDGTPGKLHLLPGAHKIRLETPDGDSWEEMIRIVADHEINIKLELDKR